MSADPSLVLPPALPEPVPGNYDEHNPNAHLVNDVHAAVAAAIENPHHVEHHGDVGVDPDGEGEGGGEEEAAVEVQQPVKKRRGRPRKHPEGTKVRRRKLLLTFHEALTYASRGIYVDIETGQLRCSCNHKPCDKLDAYGYTRHFEFKCHKRYEEERLDDVELNRLREAKATYLRMHPQVEEQSIRKRRRAEKGEKVLSVEELRVQEKHWMEMWRDSKNELRQLRQDLKEEPDEEVRAELQRDIEGMKKRKGDWARLLGLNDSTTDIPHIF